MVAERGDDIPTFNFGGTIEEIKSRCLAETHLEPPVTPQFMVQVKDYPECCLAKTFFCQATSLLNLKRDF